MDYEIKFTLNDGYEFIRGGFKTLQETIDFCKENARYYKDVEITYFTIKGEEIPMRLEDAITTQRVRESSSMRFSK